MAWTVKSRTDAARCRQVAGAVLVLAGAVLMQQGNDGAHDDLRANASATDAAHAATPLTSM